ncbi:MAG: hypothetical protein E7632_02025 [Ruminococcaceae bacterium]|nr:hypothetical protein [Oscillospiraceae bacterium]
MDYDRFRHDEMPGNRSEAVMHESAAHERGSYDKRVGGYTPNPAERETRGEPRELFSMKNSYNDLSVGADKQGSMMLTGSAVRRHNSPSLENEEKQVEGSRRKKHPNNAGELYTNPANPDKSAVAYRVDRKVPEKKILKKLRESAKRHDLGTFNETMPFIDVKENEDTLQELRRERVSEVEKQALEKTIRDKKGMERKFLEKLRFARKKLLSTDLDELRAMLFSVDGEPLMQKVTPVPEEDDGEDEADDENEQ